MKSHNIPGISINNKFEKNGSFVGQCEYPNVVPKVVLRVEGLGQLF